MNTLGKLMLLAKEQDSKIIINIFIKASTSLNILVNGFKLY